MYKVLHLIPYMGVGGVESAAQSMDVLRSGDISFRVIKIFPSTPTTPKSLLLWNPLFFVSTLTRLYCNQPDILIVSLWRSCLVGIIYRLLCPNVKLVLFLHYPEDFHLLDYLATRCAALLSSRLWSDSRLTFNNRLPAFNFSRSNRVVSFVVQRVLPATQHPLNAPNFIYWGRIHPQKGLLAAISFFSRIQSLVPNAHYTIIGPDCGDLIRVQQHVRQLSLADHITFAGPLSFQEISSLASQSSFYLQSSRMEGMAMSVVEGMQLGLVPVVTPVGEIQFYARSGYNAILLSDEKQAIRELLQLITNYELYCTYRANAIAEWSDKTLYADDVLDACHDILNAHSTCVS